MIESYRKVWERIEKEVGHCCLHKKSAFCEITGQPLERLSLVLTQPAEKIEAYVRDKSANQKGNRVLFTLDGVKVELTNYPEVRTVDELAEKAFLNTLTIDSIGIQPNGKYFDKFGGMKDIQSKTLRLTSSESVITEIAFKRILGMVSKDNYSPHESISRYIVEENLVAKESYRRRLCEMLAEALIGENKWKRAALMLNLLGQSLEDRRDIVAYVVSQVKTEPDERKNKAFLFFIYAWIGATSAEISPIFNGNQSACYLDTIAENFKKDFHRADEFFALKDKYGDEIMNLIFDVQEVFSSVKKTEYRRPNEGEFDLMFCFMSDDSRWEGGAEVSATSTAPKSVEENKEKLELVGELSCKALLGEYDAGNYEEDTEGVTTDTYTYSEESSANREADEKDEGYITDDSPVQKKEHCIDDEQFDDDDDSDHFSTSKLDSYEQDLKRCQGVQENVTSRTSQPIPESKPASMGNPHRNIQRMIDGGK